MRHLVLGSKGQIGSVLVEQLKKKHEVIEWDLVDGPEYDLRNQYDRLLNDCRVADYVHFLAFDVGGSTYLAKYQDTYDFIDNNIQLMNNVFRALRVSGTPFYFASSQTSNMYNSTYGRLKAVGESYTNALGGLNVKFWNVFGYESNPDKSHVVTDFIKMGLKGGRILCRTNGQEKRIFAYAPDVAMRLVWIAENEGKIKSTHDWAGNQPFLSEAHVSPSMPITIELLAQMIAEKLNAEVFFGTKKDKIQTINNEPNGDFERAYRFTMGNHYTQLPDALDQIIERIKQDA